MKKQDRCYYFDKRLGRGGLDMDPDEFKEQLRQATENINQNSVMKKTKEQLKQEIDGLKQQLKPLEEELHSIYETEGEEVEAKIKRCQAMKDKFSPDELRYAATSRCVCGAGLAYPKNISPHGSWYCSAILTGQAERGSSHDASFPFAFYEIKSEEQPSANRLTTRPQQ